MADGISELFDFSSAKGGKKSAKDAIDEQIAKEIAVDIQNHHVLKASKTEKASWTDRQRLNYSAGVHSSDPRANVKIHVIQKVLANHFMIKQGINLESYQNLSKMSIENS